MRKHWPKVKPKQYEPRLVIGQFTLRSKFKGITQVNVITGVSIGYQPHKEVIDPYRDTPLQQQIRLRKKLSKKTTSKLEDLDIGDWLL